MVNSGSASTVTADGLVTFAYSLPAPYRQGAAWLMNSTTAATIAKLKDGSLRQLPAAESYCACQPDLADYPVEIDEGNANIAADARQLLSSATSAPGI